MGLGMHTKELGDVSGGTKAWVHNWGTFHNSD
jgi:hypothetical protein